MRRLILSALLGVAVATNVGCFIPIYSGDPVRRTDQLIFTSEDLRNILLEWERLWLLDQPDHMTPYRVHGGVISCVVQCFGFARTTLARVRISVVTRP